MVYEYGMGTSIRAHQVPADDFNVSEAMRRTRDEEVQAIAEEAYRGAYRLLVDHRDLLDEIAERLLANEVIEHKEIRSIMDGERAAGRVARELERLAESDVDAVAGDRAGAYATKPPTDQA
jgi:cell division protease FtsH